MSLSLLATDMIAKHSYTSQHISTLHTTRVGQGQFLKHMQVTKGEEASSSEASKQPASKRKSKQAGTVLVSPQRLLMSDATKRRRPIVGRPARHVSKILRLTLTKGNPGVTSVSSIAEKKERQRKKGKAIVQDGRQIRAASKAVSTPGAAALPHAGRRGKKKKEGGGAEQGIYAEGGTR